MMFEIFEFLFDLILNFCVYFSKGRKVKDEQNSIKPWSTGFVYKEPISAEKIVK